MTVPAFGQPRSAHQPGTRARICPQRKAMLRTERAKDCLAAAAVAGVAVLVFWLLPMPGSGVA